MAADTVVLIFGDRDWQAETLEKFGLPDGPAAVSAAHGLPSGLEPDGVSTAVITICIRCAMEATVTPLVLPNAQIASAPILKQPGLPD